MTSSLFNYMRTFHISDPKQGITPVSGCMAANKAVNHVTRASFQRDSMEYLSVVGNNFSIMRNFQCRVEFVTRTLTSINVLKPLDLMDIEHLQDLISSHALMTPFHRGSLFSDTVASVVANIGLCLVHKLHATLDVYKGTGNCAAVWSAYQLELALEKLLWGNPISWQSHQCAVNLGVGLGNPSQCKTDSLGFLALEPWEKSTQSTDVPPPLTVWSSSDLTQNQMRRVFGFHDLVGEPSHIVGRRALIILIEDFYQMGVRFGMSESDFLLFLKGQGRTPPTSGTTTMNQLTHQLSQAEGVKFPMVWGAIIHMLRSQDLGQIIQAGIKELDLHYFPAFRLYDSQRHPHFMWHTSFQYLAISESCTEGQHRASVLTQVVLSEMEARKLAHVSHLRREFTRPFPWILPCANKLKPKALPERTLVTVLTFVSCVALFQNERFVSYYALRKLHDELPIRQHELRRLEILGKLPVSRFNLFQMHRVHQ
ncbi:uncharacterized protein LOC124284982 isoform X1 [Haliotis rubra]|uniref:uncharacterized protein LOC124284982 isoform X1 n=1 Tax=Haliotis rubra TaxID=36100 RepID=UPI001EE58963|nr:uncharacterized protein LOC124284982 isoform X1 [Haliotis rubra]XP_046577070.1 uncharacterized protein LOC124284982 isoform X1 [Haliotis rubra]XP_046577071.1 uncharacterized protein LOC124284982 isoform X1 [Haliotis rubra]XP_046577072.1 uncharacterized protein LOC124284982 isoform X1 [Haliotis rubra]XP_046577073.1 uncharacterized protein LOC124284982 isoform X1 [Haliotis rubra]